MKLAAALDVSRQRSDRWPDWLRLKLPSVVALLALWQVSAILIADPALFPTPWATLETGYRHLMSGDLLFSLVVTLARVIVAFGFAMVIGSAIGIALGRSQPADTIFGGWLSIALNMPALVTIVLCYVWFGLTETAAILAVTINKAPTVAAIMREGARALDRQLLETTQVFGVSRWKVLRQVVLPQLAPSFIASARAGLALTWKIVLVVELLGRPNGIGFQIRTFFNTFDIASILAYSLAFIAVVLAIETFILQPIERRTGRWRTA
jgi:NitT/TauT family transport system permease protein